MWNFYKNTFSYRIPLGDCFWGLMELYCLDNCLLIYSFQVQFYLRILIYPRSWIGTVNMQLDKHATSILHWNNVETTVSASLQRGIQMVCLLGNSIRNYISLSSFFCWTWILIRIHQKKLGHEDIISRKHDILI